MPDASRPRRVIGWTSAGLAVAVVAAGAFYVAQSADAGVAGNYRTATATKGSVSQQVALTGTVERVKQASVAFPVNGTVASVGVTVGQRVTAGQELAALDPTALKVAVVTAQATLASDKAQLASAQAGTTGSSSSSAQTTGSAVPSGSSGSSGSTRPSGSSGSSGSGSELAALKSTSGTLSRQLRTLQSANTAEGRSCAQFLTGGGSTPTGSAADSRAVLAVSAADARNTG